MYPQLLLRDSLRRRTNVADGLEFVSGLFRGSRLPTPAIALSSLFVGKEGELIFGFGGLRFASAVTFEAVNGLVRRELSNRHLKWVAPGGTAVSR